MQSDRGCVYLVCLPPAPIHPLPQTYTYPVQPRLSVLQSWHFTKAKHISENNDVLMVRLNLRHLALKSEARGHPQ